MNNTLQKLTDIRLDDTANYLYSHDLGLISYLLCKNFELVMLDKSVKNKSLFIMKRSSGIDEETKNYWNFRTSVDAQTYLNMTKRLKNQIYSSE